jgi:amino acid transporter
MGCIAGWGIKESVTLAGAMTLIEVGGLVLLIAAGFLGEADLVARLPEMLPPANPAALVGLIGAAHLAVFAFIGFEALVNVAEEMHAPRQVLPRAIFLTLALTTLLYVLVIWVALVAVSPAELSAAKAPLALVFERLTGASPRTMSLIAVVATLNGIIVQIILAARVLYGLGRQGTLPGWLGRVNPATQTPLLATGVIVALVLALGLMLPLEHLADLTSRFTLMLFALTNLALIRIKTRESAPSADSYVTPRWVPWAGFMSCIVFLLADLLALLGASGA